MNLGKRPDNRIFFLLIFQCLPQGVEVIFQHLRFPTFCIMCTSMYITVDTFLFFANTGSIWLEIPKPLAPGKHSTATFWLIIFSQKKLYNTMSITNRKWSSIVLQIKTTMLFWSEVTLTMGLGNPSVLTWWIGEGVNMHWPIRMLPHPLQMSSCFTHRYFQAFVSANLSLEFDC